MDGRSIEISEQAREQEKQQIVNEIIDRVHSLLGDAEYLSRLDGGRPFHIVYTDPDGNLVRLLEITRVTDFADKISAFLPRQIRTDGPNEIPEIINISNEIPDVAKGQKNISSYSFNNDGIGWNFSGTTKEVYNSQSVLSLTYPEGFPFQELQEINKLLAEQLLLTPPKAPI